MLLVNSSTQPFLIISYILPDETNFSESKVKGQIFFLLDREKGGSIFTILQCRVCVSVCVVHHGLEDHVLDS